MSTKIGDILNTKLEANIGSFKKFYEYYLSEYEGKRNCKTHNRLRDWINLIAAIFPEKNIDDCFSIWDDNSIHIILNQNDIKNLTYQNLIDILFYCDIVVDSPAGYLSIHNIDGAAPDDAKIKKLDLDFLFKKDLLID